MLKKSFALLMFLSMLLPLDAFAQEEDGSGFVPGNELLLFDDFTDMPRGAAPPHWKVRGAAVRLVDGRLTVGAGSSTRMTPNITTWPDSFTVEMNVQAKPSAEDALRNITWVFENGDAWAWQATLTLHANGQCGAFVEIADPGENSRAVCNWLPDETNNIALWVQDGRLRIYLNGQRLIDMNQLRLSFQTASLIVSADAIPVSFGAFRIAQSNADADTPILAGGSKAAQVIQSDIGLNRGPVPRPALAAMQTSVSQPTATTQYQQRFNITGNQRTNLVFGVTSPGLVTIHLSWQGAALSIDLVNLGTGGKALSKVGKPATDELSYSVTAEDIRNGLVWAVSIWSNSASSGTVTVTCPTPDHVLLDAYMATNKEKISAYTNNPAVAAQSPGAGVKVLPAVLVSFSAKKPEVFTPEEIMLEFALDRPAQLDCAIALKADNPYFVILPAEVVIPVGSTTYALSVGTRAVQEPKDIKITAELSGLSKTLNIKFYPGDFPSSLKASMDQMAIGKPLALTVSIYVPQTKPTTFKILSDQISATEVTIPAGQTTASATPTLSQYLDWGFMNFCVAPYSEFAYPCKSVYSKNVSIKPFDPATVEVGKFTIDGDNGTGTAILKRGISSLIIIDLNAIPPAANITVRSALLNNFVKTIYPFNKSNQASAVVPVPLSLALGGKKASGIISAELNGKTVIRNIEILPLRQVDKTCFFDNAPTAGYYNIYFNYCTNEISPGVFPGGQTAYGFISRGFASAEPVNIELFSSDPTIATVSPTTISISGAYPQQRGGLFTVKTTTSADGPKNVTIRVVEGGVYEYLMPLTIK